MVSLLQGKKLRTEMLTIIPRRMRMRRMIMNLTEFQLANRKLMKLSSF
jgi:hypothetical protein